MILILGAYWITWAKIEDMKLVINGKDFKIEKIYGPLWKVESK